MPEKVLVAMSGGVDSSVAAALLHGQGHEVVGCFMRLGSVDEPEGLLAGDAARAVCDNRPERKRGCCSVNDAADAAHVAAVLGVPFYVLNFRRDFQRVIDDFVDGYNAGRTPNPCIRCNDWLKFGRLHAHAAAIGCDAVASGHYARVLPGPGGAELHRGLDPGKDQSYVLFGSPAARLAEMRLPVGGFPKAEVRAMAERFGLPVFDKPDSQEICFVPDNDHAAFVEARTPGGFAEGDLIGPDGGVVGRHGGHQRFTPGQRRGVGVAFGMPIYVTAKDPATNAVTLGPRERLRTAGCTAAEANWLVPPPPEGRWARGEAQVRAHGEPIPCRYRGGGDRLEVRFDGEAEAVAAGQAVVVYAGTRVQAGGWVTAADGSGEERHPVRKIP
ncbi:tRNA 2-thiouridine(34) synthase MnmA [Phycisphaera mikurensis]|uniref:tRNA-specific 2-thiouridylase MnmA n=1 Tax=Phycisphaera mikurensis (strain NBRC 102666 / KCTC 22515 / FYK2301M01) TaxID=1142394 RepID=I0IAG5_PHYMF|nr:tRNA 2-thiouridine(34) synthase MnmA [Phycisphaera mikurensis]MBB6441750.1 tRNA-specific 2-thiouridylase [Phycisphaera mikurensis]BAM02253.1 tRNA-specific 2-thiouridylase MnmA [Phycisphaera mikurensis NBRC 102666]